MRLGTPPLPYTSAQQSSRRQIARQQRPKDHVEQDIPRGGGVICVPEDDKEQKSDTNGIPNDEGTLEEDLRNCPLDALRTLVISLKSAWGCLYGPTYGW